MYFGSTTILSINDRSSIIVWVLASGKKSTGIIRGVTPTRELRKDTLLLVVSFISVVKADVEATTTLNTARMKKMWDMMTIVTMLLYSSMLYLEGTFIL
mmetsp:Transcript_44648/g.49824  ORF Transcript_44648/g.49824 Transcript_44648/m.49824 type:complete len:99 (+) Transcript_44648:383-679(+)